MADDNERIRDLEQYCNDCVRPRMRHPLSLDILREKLSHVLSQTAIACSYFFHEMLLSPSVTLEMVELVLELHPYAAHFTTTHYHPRDYDDSDVNRSEWETNGFVSPGFQHLCSDRSYPIHNACSNKGCPPSIIELLAKNNPSALGHLCVLKHTYGVDDEHFEGVPLHYYLSRESNMDLATVKIMVDECPESTMKSGVENKLFPIHVIVSNDRVGELYDIVQCMIDLDPSCLQLKDYDKQIPLHRALYNQHVTTKIVHLLLYGRGESLQQIDCNGCLPLHQLCENRCLDETEKLNILRIVVQQCPESLIMANSSQQLPLHIAARCQSADFCKILVQPKPDSVKQRDVNGDLPFHMACQNGRLDTVQYLYEMYPESITMKNGRGSCALLLVLNGPEFFFEGMFHSQAGFLAGTDQTAVVQFLVKIVPGWAQSFDGNLSLHVACRKNAKLGTIRFLFDAHPDALYIRTSGGKDLLDICADSLSRAFLSEQLNDFTECTNMESFPIHHAINRYVTLGVVKLLLNKFPDQVQAADEVGQLPLHIACRLANIQTIQYLAGLDQGNLLSSDACQNYPLHYACGRGRCDIVNCLLEAKTAAVMERNSNSKLPIELLLEAECDHDSLEFVEAMWRFLVASPEMISA